jgi:3'-phosphoadenosine 5'-phosphosulfate sulfotransferase (PAPS reductase)/FAD synthetase
MDHLEQIEAQSIYILREAYKHFGKLGMLWSIGKDSTVMLWLAQKALNGARLQACRRGPLRHCAYQSNSLR